MNRLALFDCDGTLVDSQATICRSIAQSFTTLGLEPPTREASLNIVGLSVHEAMAVLHPAGSDEEHRALGNGYKAAFAAIRAAGEAHEPLYDGIADTLDHLQATGWVLGVATGKSDRGLNLVLTGHGMLDRFVTLQTADRHPSKPHPSMVELAMREAGAGPATTVMIGDTSYDMAMAKAAGAHAVGVAWGYHDEAALRGAGADVIVRHPDELAAVLEGLA